MTKTKTGKAKKINWNSTPAEHAIIMKIAKRAVALFSAYELDLQSIQMDVSACHLNGTPLRLADLLAADDANFGHDIFGIQRSLDRTTGKLDPMFCPRFAKGAE